MLSDRLIRMVESHADELTRGTVKSLRDSPHASSYQALTDDDIYERVYRVYHDLGRWLAAKTDDPLKNWHHQLGKKRFHQGIPLCELVWALTLTKHFAFDYIRLYGFADSALELHQQIELHHLLDHFFDRAVFYTIEGYEHAATVDQRHAAVAGHS